VAVRRLVTKRWYVRFADGLEYDCQPGETVSVMTIDHLTGEAMVSFDGRHRWAWFSLHSLLFHSNRIFSDDATDQP
jgi:hypothetical protein